MAMCSFNLKVQTLLIYYIGATIGTMVFKLMSSQEVDEGGHHRIFYHPYMETFIMFLGQSLCLIIHYYNKKSIVLSEQEKAKEPYKVTAFIIPSMSDCCASVLQYIALNFITGSSYRMFQGASIITTAIFSKILFNMSIQKRHLTGCGLAFFGLLLVGGSGFIENKSSDGEEIGTQLLGYILMLISLVFVGYHFAYEQRLMMRHSMSPMEMVGWEGIFGLVAISIISVVLSFVPCNLGESLCVYNNEGDLYYERFDQFFIQLAQNWVVALLVVVATISVAVSNQCGVTITKMFDALTFCLVSMSKTPVVWGIGLIITISTEGNPNYHLQSTNVAVTLVKIFGFVFIIFGTLIYNKLIFKKYFADKEAVNLLEQKEADSENQIQKSLIQ